MMFASGHDDDDYDDDDDDYGPSPDDRGRDDGRRAARTTSSRTVAGGGRHRTVNFQPEERYWTDYLRIALPIIGLLLMIGLFWYWATQLIGDGGTDETPTEPAGQPQLAVDPSTPLPSQTPTGAGQAQQPTSEPPVGTPPADEPTEVPAPEETEAASADGTAGELAIGGSALITENGVNLRPDPTTEGEPVTTLAEGTVVTVNAGPEEAGGFTWWQITVDDTELTGWVVVDYLEPAP